MQTPVPVCLLWFYSDQEILALSPLQVPSRTIPLYASTKQSSQHSLDSYTYTARETPRYGFSWLCDDAAILRTPWEREYASPEGLMELFRKTWFETQIQVHIRYAPNYFFEVELTSHVSRDVYFSVQNFKPSSSTTHLTSLDERVLVAWTTCRGNQWC